MRPVSSCRSSSSSRTCSSPTRARSSAATSAWCGRGSRMRAFSTTRTARSGSKRACRSLPGSFTTTSSAASSSASSASSSWPAAERAAWLSKADLLTGMVGEFPELQGFMGRYYALHDGEPREVADAIEAHYRPRFAGDHLPDGMISCSVAVADKLDALAGLFGIGQAPTGERDPFGLRRAALGVVRILVERGLELSLFELVKREDVASFIFERARGYFQERGYSAVEVDSVLSLRPARLDLRSE